MPLGEKENVLLLKSLPIYVGWLLYTKIPGKIPGISYFSGNFPGSREAQNPGKMEPLTLLLIVVPNGLNFGGQWQLQIASQLKTI